MSIANIGDDIVAYENILKDVSNGYLHDNYLRLPDISKGDDNVRPL